jgi:biopolymer transport protein ExbD
MYDTHLRRARKPAGLLLVPMIDIFTVLVTFLLMTAVFARITVLQLDLPSAASGNVTEPTFRLEVIVRKEGLELTNGSTRIAALPAVNGEYDLKTLSELALSLKREYPQVDSASVLMEPDVRYDYLIQVMDAIRSTEVPAGEAADQSITATDSADARPTRVAMFTRIAVGDAP